jgi:hypothetical protein
MDIFEILFASSIQNNEAGFVREHPGPFLLRSKTAEEMLSTRDESGLLQRPNSQDSGSRLTKAPILINEESISVQRPRISPTGELEAASEPPASTNQYACYAVEKTNRNVFANGITVGRTANNDVVIPLVTISKFHAWFKREAGSYVLYDAINSQGTFVGSQKVSPNGEQGIFLFNRVEIRFGITKLTFLDAAGLYGWFQNDFIG